MAKKRTIQSMGYAPGGIVTDDKGPLGKENLTGVKYNRFKNWTSGPASASGMAGKPIFHEKAPAYGAERQEIEESGEDLGAKIRERGFSDENLGEAPPVPPKEVEEAVSGIYPLDKETWTPRTSRGMLMEGQAPQSIQKRSMWDFLKTRRRREKEEGNRFFDMTGRERSEARKQGFGWKNEYWDDPNASILNFRIDNKRQKFDLNPNKTPPQMPMF